MSNMAASMHHMEKESEKLIFPLKSGASLVKTPPVFSNDSRCLFCCSGSVVKVYSTVSGECMRELKGHKDIVTGVVINPNNKLQLVSCSMDGTIIVWDYTDGILLRTLPMSAPMFGLYTAAGENLLFVLKMVSKSDCVLVKQPLTSHKRETIVLTHCSKDRKMTAIGAKASYVVRITGKQLHVKSRNAQSFVFKTDYEQMTCVACHPKDPCIATGCKDGKILIWYGFLSNSDVRTVLHWHALPVKHLAFTVEGSYLMSGGHECVLVKWHNGSQYNDFLPRLGAPINYIVCSSDNTLSATAHDDNVIQVISSNFRVEHVFQGLTRGHLKSQEQNPIPAGLLYDPRSRSLVLNGRPGHIQFYSVQEDKHLFNLDIVQQNYISPGNLKQPLSVTEVTGASFDTTGTWLATTEYWSDGVMSPEIRLKFWHFDEEKQSYVLNTTVELPHEQRVASLQFRPHSETSSPDTEHMLVTSSADGKFKVWLLVDDTDIYRKNTKWSCESVGFYQDLPAGQVSFSEDGSLLAVVFGSKITLWEPEICLLKRSLTQSVSSEEIRYIEFGHCQCCQYLVSCTSSQLIVWSLITCTVSWTVDLRVTSIVADPVSEIMAIFTDNKDLFVFKPSSPDPVFSHVAVSTKDVISSVFIPQSQKNLYEQKTLTWQNSSQLYFMNRQQELRTVMLEADTVSTKKHDSVTVEENLPQTALSLLVSTTGKTSKEVKVTQKTVPREPSGAYLKEMLVSASHSLPSVTSLCQPFINSLLIGQKQNSNNKVKEDDGEDDDDISETSPSSWQHSRTGTTDSGVDSDMEIDLSQEKTESKVTQSNANITKEKQLKPISDSPVKQFSDFEVTEILAEDTNWYLSLKKS